MKSEILNFMSADLNMDGRLQVILLRAYAQNELDVKNFPWVAMESEGSWYAHPIEPRFGRCGVWESMFCVPLGVNGGMAEAAESLFCWNAGLVKNLTAADDDACVRSPLSVVRTVWLAIKEGEALRADVTMVCEPLPSPQEVPSVRRPTDEELDDLMGMSWSEFCPLDV